MVTDARKLPLPEGAVDELKALLESYARLKVASKRDHAGADAEMATLQERVEKKRESLNWSDLMQAELCTVDLVGDADVRARLASWRRRMREVIGESRYASYVSTTVASDDPVVLRADLIECISTVNYFYGAYGVAARSRGSVTISLMWFAGVILAVQAALGFLIGVAPRVHLDLPSAALDFLLATSAAAVVGSVISVQRRLQDPRVDVDPYYRYIQTSADPLGVALISVLFGSIFGLLVYGLLVSGLIAGPEFPKFNKETGVPEGAPQVALLLIYGFIAGFAEQFVPDALTRIAARTLGDIRAKPHGFDMRPVDGDRGE